MKLLSGGFLLIICSLATASAVPVEDLDLFGTGLAFIDGICQTSRFINWLRVPPKINNIFFELRTPCKRSKYLVSEANKLHDSSDFDVNKKTVVFVSGWRSDMDEPYTEELTKAYHCRSGHNFIVVDTAEYIQSLDYIECAFNTKFLGESIAMGLKKLNIPGENIHLIGHSLGAHIVGSAGNKFEQLTKTKIGRITGLDPARPCFTKKSVFRKLRATDATFVDIIHSNSKEAGTEEAIGHADFYPGGMMSTQPKCELADIKCSHTMSIKYYAESVFNGNDKNFIGAKCENERKVNSEICNGPKTAMGFAADENAKGVYVLEVEKSAPYGRNARRSSDRKLESCGKCEKQ